MAFRDSLLQAWYRPRLTPLTAALTPLALGFALVVRLRRAWYRLRPGERIGVPVVVVGNITIGGTGKTPLVLALTQALRERGWHPGIISRGYGGSNALPRAVSSSDRADVVGDEALLLAASGVPVWIGRARVAAARSLAATHADVDVILCDDGLQHYALNRDVEIAAIDGARGVGNGWPLPAGPLREPATRLTQVDAVVCTGECLYALPIDTLWRMHLRGVTLRNLADATRTAAPAELADRRVHAIAGIGNPQRFFEGLRGMGLNPVCHAFPDHHAYSRGELVLPDAQAIVMTEKDAVKCAAFADARMWVLPVSAELPPAFIELVVEKIRGSQIARNSRLPDHQRPAHLR